ncbi:LysR substrate-binding domain-containing protein [Sphingomonas sp. AR_OL41]|uniref:LysR substrate-binding domain-containing protein n=1 Tax=Sphingomonas sp. AR_OL41 TaxID=3042729 RepID=UPI0024813344|nr:LysR substrate-binding domain-containing protein [Sphingomonas sp. AR_OL41]MDH7972101.1 LysR substrate-binding domain-containing protein [Sphingomonas sp. AR_OL41]
MSRFHENFLLGRLKLRQLKLIAAVAQEGNILRGSQVLNIAQPAATKSIKELEEALGVQLFDRSSRGVTPTLYGDVIIKHAKLILTQLRHASEELQSIESGLSGRVFVGTLLAASPTLLPRSLALLRERRPGVAVTVIEGTIDKLMPALRTGDLDIVLGRLPDFREREGVDQEVLYNEPIAIVARDGHPLAAQSSVSLAEIASQAWILPPSETSLRRQLMHAFRRADLEPPIDAIESVSILVNHALLLESDLLAAMPYQVATVQPGLTILPVDMEATASRIGATTRAGITPSAAVTCFMDMVREVAATIRANMPSDGGV